MRPSALVFLMGACVAGAAGVAISACGSTRRDFSEPPAGADAGGTFVDGAGNGSCVPDPGNYDVPKNGCDDDGNGVIDDAPSCDANLPTFSGTADDIAKAIGLCTKASGAGWGVVSATLTRGHASNITTPPAAGQYSILPGFGKVVRAR
jgi:hypothetical protein